MHIMQVIHFRLFFCIRLTTSSRSRTKGEEQDARKKLDSSYVQYDPFLIAMWSRPWGKGPIAWQRGWMKTDLKACRRASGEPGVAGLGAGVHKVVMLDSGATVRAILTPRRLNVLLHMHEQGRTVRRDAVQYSTVIIVLCGVRIKVPKATSARARGTERVSHHGQYKLSD